MPCPWYQYGMCTSPRLSEPTDTVVTVDRCNSDFVYVNCAYYVGELQKATTRRVSTKKDKTKIYTPIHALPPHLECQCPECVVTDDNGIKVAYCRILDRYLTRYEVYICSRHWKECPYRHLQQ